ncbi:hypothetical protein RIF29_00612 [Crotalaria pallida]|uniref:Uncharacterized protein n=1 Tax=Crotalaria pallida TaxID=3830 RepID=A0AAN9IWA2_CROPI
MEVDSIRDFEKQLSYDCAETSVKIKKKKKKKAKYLGSAYNHGWQLDSVVLNEQARQILEFRILGLYKKKVLCFRV